MESRSKTFSTTYVCFEHALHEKRLQKTLLERQFKLSGLLQYSLLILKDPNVSVVTCLHISHLVSPHDLQQPFLFSKSAAFALTRMFFKILALLTQL